MPRGQPPIENLPEPEPVPVAVPSRSHRPIPRSDSDDPAKAAFVDATWHRLAGRQDGRQPRKLGQARAARPGWGLWRRADQNQRHFPIPR